MRILVTGARGFIGKNLLVRLGERAGVEAISFARGDGEEKLAELVAQADAIVHLAGENRPSDVADFARVNTDLTRTLCAAMHKTGRPIPLILASSTQAERDNPYGQSKRAAEAAVEAFANETGNPVVIYRLPGVFGKWCKPNYNSVVATFCHNIAHDLPIQVNDAGATLRLVYIDDVVDEFLRALDHPLPGRTWGEVQPDYAITLGALAEQIRAFRNCRMTLMSERVGTGLTRALYSTYVSYLPPERFAYDLPRYGDERGIFVEMLKTPDCGQFSFFTVHPGVTRGSHYHHSKTEKFLVLRGSARMRFRHMVTGETYEITVSGDKPQVVDSIPGWVHDITNVGDSEAVVMLWANEVFDRQRPDCIPCEV
ncbi:MAG: SDR family oxidoreductase [Betaproteobacteria bacterium]|nr:SDR family oxidoreductase [Betaproteobacteria bacterium]